MTRDERQRKVFAWAKAAFGIAHATSIPQRGLRMLEESVELFQACGGDQAMAHKLVDFVFGRPAGDIGQELGGVGVTVLALAAAVGLSADDQENREVNRVHSKPPEEFAKRNAAKNAAGFSYTSGAAVTADEGLLDDLRNGRVRELEAKLVKIAKENVLAERAMRSAVSSSKAFEQLAMRYFDAKDPLERIADAAVDLLRLLGDGCGGRPVDGRLAFRAAALRDALALRKEDADAAAMLASLCSNLGPTHNED